MTKIEFLNRLEPDKLVEDIVLQLKRESLPLVLWGCGDVANSVYHLLHTNGVAIDLVWDDGNDIGKKFHDIEITSIHEVKKRFSKFNVVLGHSQYDKGVGLTKHHKQIENVFFPFSVSYGLNEKITFEAISTVADRFAWLCVHLADQRSVTNLIAYLNTKLTGNAQYILDIYQQQMSFFHNDVFELTDHETYLDIGAYTGDTIQSFLKETNGKYDGIIALEPDEANFLKLTDYIAKKSLKNTIASRNGAWNCRMPLQFRTGNEEISSVDNGSSILQESETITIYGERLDYLFGDRNITLIKINYYTGVKEALEGCEDIIRKNRPKLAISVGFDIYNILELSEWIDSLNIGYKFFLRFNRAMSSAFILYAIAEKEIWYAKK